MMFLINGHLSFNVLINMVLIRNKACIALDTITPVLTSLILLTFSFDFFEKICGLSKYYDPDIKNTRINHE